MTTTPKAPPLCPQIYHDGQNLYLELPGHPGQCLRFALTEGGLHKALKHIPRLGRTIGQVTGNGNIASVKPKIAASTHRKRELAKASPSVRSAATAVIRKLKLGE
jgi:hypothetical protein